MAAAASPLGKAHPLVLYGKQVKEACLKERARLEFETRQAEQVHAVTVALCPGVCFGGLSAHACATVLTLTQIRSLDAARDDYQLLFQAHLAAKSAPPRSSPLLPAFSRPSPPASFLPSPMCLCECACMHASICKCASALTLGHMDGAAKR